MPGLSPPLSGWSTTKSPVTAVSALTQRFSRRPGRVAPEADSRGREGDRQEADSTGGPDQHRGRQLRGIGSRQQVGKSREDQGSPSVASRVVEQFKRRNRNEGKSYQITTIDAGFRLAGPRRVADGHARPAESRKPADGARQHQEKQGSDKPYRRPTEDQSFGPRHHTENPKRDRKSTRLNSSHANI